jgi:hypothetical protein
MSEPDKNTPTRAGLFTAPEAPDPDAITSEDEQPGEFHATMDIGDVDLHDRSAEVKAIREREQEDGTAPPPMPDDRPFDDRNPLLMRDPTRGVMDEIVRRFKTDVGNAVVEVTATERDAFVRAALHDREMVFFVTLPGVDTTVEVAIPNDSFTAAASSAAYHWGKLGVIDPNSDMQWLLSFQQLHAWFQIRSIDGQPTQWSEYWATSPSSAEIRMFMRRPSHFEQFFNMNAVRWRMLMDAMRTAEEKYKICLNNWHNRTFFTGAGTA